MNGDSDKIGIMIRIKIRIGIWLVAVNYGNIIYFKLLIVAWSCLLLIFSCHYYRPILIFVVLNFLVYSN